MIDRITLRDLAGLKLIHDSNYVATVSEAQNALEAAYVQASQGWGLHPAQSNLLRMATELGRALAAETKYDETQKALKAEQMRRGRIQKQLDKAQARIVKAENKEVHYQQLLQAADNRIVQLEDNIKELV